MVMLTPVDAELVVPLIGSRAVLDIALRRTERGGFQQVHATVDGLRQLAREGAGLSLRLAMVLASIWRMDIAELGYTSRGVFLAERVGLGTTWARQLVRLVDSPLDLVKQAVTRGEVSLRDAVAAVGNVEPDGQLAWLAGLGREDADEGEAPVLLDLDGTAADAVREARRVARVLLGRRAPNLDVDAFILEAFRRRVPLEQLLDQARARPERPPEPGPADFGWCAAGPPAERLLGPWVEPESLRDALEQLDLIKRLRDQREAVLARAWAVLDHLAVWAELGFEDRWLFALEVFGWPKRTAQRRKQVGWALEWYPELDEAVRRGLGLGAAALLATVIADKTSERWLAVAERVTSRELARAVGAARDDVSSRATLLRYEAAANAADGWLAEGAPVGGEVPAPLAGEGPLKVSLAHPEPPRQQASGRVRAGEEVVEAARWWVENVVLPPRRGFDAVKERDGYRCQNPECLRVSFRVEAHHVEHRAHGGDDSSDNGLSLCRTCHLRGLHTGGEHHRPRICTAKVHIGDALAILWEYAEGRRVLQFRADPA